MALAPGSRVGQYEILFMIGVGGMGEVYRARDPRLDREVALKVLPQVVAEDPERLARFDREARLLASLNHQNIAHLLGFEDADDHPALVMELVEGPTLADRVAGGALALEEALPIARQIAEALEAAHQQGIVHRDLKPANIKVRDDGTVKVLDFGLAKALQPPSLGDSHRTSTSLAESPTITSDMTLGGVVLGTAAYMSPEAARGKQVDKRADLWGFGCVLYEILTARRPFAGETAPDVLAKIMEREPDWSALPARTPPSIRTLLRRCLEKDPRRRLDSAAVARMEIDDASSPVEGERPTGANAMWRRWAPLALAMMAVVLAAFGAWRVARVPLSPPAVSRFAITLPPAQSLAYSFNDSDVALSADGRHIVYTSGSAAQLMVRSLDRLAPVALPGIVNARAPFLSPDDRWIAFFDRVDEGAGMASVVGRGSLKKVPLEGGPPIVVASLVGASRGASWGADGSIVFATSDPSTGLLRVSEDGGETEVLTRPDTANDERDHDYPSILPGGRGVLFTIRRQGTRQVAVLDLRTGDRRTLIRSGAQAEYVETGHLVYADEGALWAVRFDLSTLEVRGAPVPLVEQVLTAGASSFAVSQAGSLVYVPAYSTGPRSLVWVDRRGSETAIEAPLREYRNVRVSPDGSRLAVQISSPPAPDDIWLWDFRRPGLTRLTFGPVYSTLPVWMPDGRSLVFNSPVESLNVSNIFRRSVDGTGAAERLTTSDQAQRVNSISPDGTRVVFEQDMPPNGYDLMLLALPDLQTTPLLQTPFDERNGVISPDGRWMAYESTETGQSQVYVRSFPNVTGAQYQISGGGGRTPVWSPDGSELFFANGSSMMAATVRLSPSFDHDIPVKLFDAPPFVIVEGRFIFGTMRMYDVSPDGQRFVMIRQDAGPDDRGGPPVSMVVVQHWSEELKARVPARPE